MIRDTSLNDVQVCVKNHEAWLKDQYPDLPQEKCLELAVQMAQTSVFCEIDFSIYHSISDPSPELKTIAETLVNILNKMRN